MIKGYPFDNADYSAADVAAAFADVMSNGVNIYGNADALKVAQGTGMTVNITNGTGRINGRMFKVDGETLAVAAGTAVARIDRVVVKMNAEAAPNFSVYVKQGTTAPPSLERNASGSIYEISLATLTVVNSTITIQDDRADATLCGFVSFMGSPPFYPTGTVPQDLWLYSVFPGELTTAQKQAVEANPALMNKWYESPIFKNMINVGTYSGNGAASRKISLPKTPKFVYVLRYGTESTFNGSSGTSYFGGMAIAGNPARDSAGRNVVEIVNGGFNIFVDHSSLAWISSNENATSYTYIWG